MLKRLLDGYARRDPVRALTYWSISLVVATALVVFGAVHIADIKADKVREWAPSVSAIIAAISLLLGGFTYAASSRRHRRELTLRAWGEFSDAKRSTRRQLRNWAGEVLPSPAAEQMASLASTPMVEIDDPEQRKMADRAHELNDVLNRLERLAAGWEDGLYDIEILERIAATPIISTHRRYEPYIRALRKETGIDSTFSAIQNLAADLRQRHPNS